jgi:protein gp37
MQERWLLDLRDRCIARGVAFFFKQWGGRTPKAGGRTLEGREWSELPITLRQLKRDKPRAARMPS